MAWPMRKGERQRHGMLGLIRFEVATWFSWLVCHDINLKSRHRCSGWVAWACRDKDFHVATQAKKAEGSPKSRHQFEVATWLGWDRQVLGRDMILCRDRGQHGVRRKGAWLSSCTRDRAVSSSTASATWFWCRDPVLRS